MRAYFLNSRTGRHGPVNIRIDDDTLGRFVGGAFLRRLVSIGKRPFLVISEFGEEPDGILSARCNDGERLYGNLLILGFGRAYRERDMTEDESETVKGEITDASGSSVLWYGRAE